MQTFAPPAGSVRYVPLADRELPPEQQSVIHFRPLTLGERAAMQDNLTVTERGPDGTTTQRWRVAQQSVELCVRHIERIENVPVGAPEAWPASREDRLKYLERLGILAVVEIAGAIRDAGEASEAAKN